MVKMHQTSTKSKYIKRFSSSEEVNRMVFSNALMRPKLDKDALQWTLELVKEIESCWKRTGIIIDDNNVNQALLENKEIINLPNWMCRFHMI
ncbi:hypothetical protein F8M41_012082 [Gigaspora margarita]|uniref:Uncharacterized protein n=1 Tax=Gigaspora margarita TaxID=4874 RepID=A0A8H4AT80_GIGMA|nr:hypothetical protein F8M41_012082 [Gigaspora margarita]